MENGVIVSLKEILIFFMKKKNDTPVLYVFENSAKLLCI